MVSEQEAWRVFFDLYLPVMEALPQDPDGRDPLALELPLDLRRVLVGRNQEQQSDQPSVDVIVCVHDALDDVRRCLAALLAHSDRRFRLIVVNDGSGIATTAVLNAFAEEHPAVRLIDHPDAPHGYPIAANLGLRASTSDYTILLNSDTIVSHGWLGRLVDYGELHETVGILGPLSNAAGHQSVPAVREDGAWAVNPLPAWLTVEGAAAALERAAPRTNTRLPFINGFCYVIKRAALEAVGLLDELSFPGGYCEENDYSQRARDAGFDLAVVDDAYVYHANSRSYGKERRAELAPRNYQTFLNKHGRERIQALVAGMEADRTLAPVRSAFANATASPRAFAEVLVNDQRGPLSLVFIFSGSSQEDPDRWHSLRQEVQGLAELGIPARIAVPQQAHGPSDHDANPPLLELFANSEDLAAATADADVIIATDTVSATTLQALRTSRTDFLPAYRLYDYEPFCADPLRAERAIASYTAIPDALLLAGSQWLCNLLARRHGLSVAMVASSPDRPPADRGEQALDERLLGGQALRHFAVPDEPTRAPMPLRVVARIDPHSVRQQPRATIAVLTRLLGEVPAGVSTHTFGCTEAELLALASSAAHAVELGPLIAGHRGVLTPEGVTQLLRESDVLLDMSIYSASIDTALRAMACGATAVVPARGAVWELIDRADNAIAVDTADPAAVYQTLASLALDGERLGRLRANAVLTAARHPIARAALSQYLIFERAHRARFHLAVSTPQLAG
jgi:GT2 family glycosyltransferase